ncbi:MULTISPECIES: monovalent cation/H+ antiporter complex subunit F [unclassified Halobacteriovorax]|uniref:monovalent cation/H+ antiporter complex subunit F n=1 Tax=unclassified Halobacteriovorax TaxID=2639665 RepID=UPI000EA31ACB|nr:MrpF/PhaF family protein [Halobacteriovorax sp. BALOs_7]AYF43835.1 multiple resistance and pH regulation protein F, MrpF/PhaF family [Halobacteriovorax sp. BALOs_7]
MSILMMISTGIIILTCLLLVFEAVKERDVLVKVLAFDLIGVTGVSLFLMLYTNNRNPFFLNIAQLIAIVGFVTALVFAFYLSEMSKEDK